MSRATQSQLSLFCIGILVGMVFVWQFVYLISYIVLVVVVILLCMVITRHKLYKKFHFKPAPIQQPRATQKRGAEQ